MKLSFTHFLSAGALALLLCGGSLAAQNKHDADPLSGSAPAEAYGMKDIELDPDCPPPPRKAPIDLGAGAVLSDWGALNISPNPVATTGTVRFTVHQAGQVSLQLFDVNGRQVQATLSTHATDVDYYRVSLTTDDLQNGMYFLRMTGPTGESLTRRFLVAH